MLRFQGRVTAAVLCFAAIFTVTPTRAEAPQDAKAPQSEEKASPNPDAEVEAAPDSPRSAVGRFLDLVREGKEGTAADVLTLGPKMKGQGEDLARKLAAVLEAQPSFSLENVSPYSNGTEDDGLPKDEEEIGRVVTEGRASEAIVMVQRPTATGKTWRFSAPTLERVPTWYERTPNAWASKHLPPWLSKRVGGGLQLWQWGGLMLLALVAWAVGYLMSTFAFQLAQRLAKKTSFQWDDELLSMLRGPMTLACTLVVAALGSPLLALPESADALYARCLRGGGFVVFFWLGMRAVDFVSLRLVRAPFAVERPASRSLIALGSRVTKAALFTIVVIAVLSELGFPVASLIAGLGIGGLAVALAGQKTLENLLGTFAIGFDQPFREGDYIKTGDTQGTVETIGLRSTRVRTPDRTIVTLPNGKLADVPVESVSMRDRNRVNFTLSLPIGSKPGDVRALVSKLETVVKAQTKVEASSVLVALVSMNDWALKLEVNAIVGTTDANEFARVRQEVYLQVMEAVEAAGLEVAMPTQRTIQVPSEKRTNGAAGPRPSAPA